MGSEPRTRIDGIFDDLVVRYGWGMYGDSSELRANPPRTIDRFVDCLLAIDGRDPAFATRQERQLLWSVVDDWVFDVAGKGARSGLPISRLSHVRSGSAAGNPTVVEGPESYISGFPVRFSRHTEGVMDLLGQGLLPGIAGDRVVVDGEELVLPGRVYVDPPSASLFGSESPVERLITSCVLSRHQDGFVRQEQVRRLIASKELWAVPYVLALVGEYVIEIHQEIADHLPSALRRDEQKRDAYAQVLVSNPDWWRLLQQRVISYWAIYYRLDYPMMRPKRLLPGDYPAAQVIRELSSTSKELTLLRPLTHPY